MKDVYSPSVSALQDVPAGFGYLHAAGAEQVDIRPSRLLPVCPCNAPDLLAGPDLEHVGDRRECVVHNVPVHLGELGVG